MKIETLSEQRARILEDAKTRKVPGRTPPRGYQWNGLDQPGCAAAKRRLRQAEKLRGKQVMSDVLKTIQTLQTSIGEGEEFGPHEMLLRGKALNDALCCTEYDEDKTYLVTRDAITETKQETP